MVNRRACLVIAAIAGGAAIASCSSDKVTGGPGGKALAQTLDSLYRVDSAAGATNDIKTIGEEEAAFLADEGLEPTDVQVSTDGGTIHMRMFAAAGVDTTAQGKIADSVSLVYGWTADYQTWLFFFTEQFAKNGPPVVPAAIGPRGSRARAALMTSLIARNSRRTHAAVDIDSLQGDWEGFMWDHGTTIESDSASGAVSWTAASGRCSWQGVALEERFQADSALSCVRANYSARLTLHNIGSVTSLVHVSFPEQLMSALRLIGFQF